MIRLDALFQDDMILQRGKPVPVRGRANPGDRITVEIQGLCAQGTADAEGIWCVTLPALAASDTEALTVTARPAAGAQDTEDCLQLHNVAVGEVWIAGGQSNMEFWMRYEQHRAGETAFCPNPRLRFFDVPKVCYEGELEEFDYSRMGVWRTATDEDLDYFSASAYYFQKELSADLNLPVGILGCNWGGTIAAAWMDPETVARIGQPWMDWFHGVPEYQDMDAYLAAQHGKPVNDHGNPFGDYFLESVLPRTLDGEEARRFLDTMPADTAAIFEDYMYHPQPQSVPGSLYEYMLKTIASFPVRGVLWDQGGGDDEFGLSDHYQTMLTGLIGDWRALWNDETMPFLIVQNPPSSYWLLEPVGTNHREIRRAHEAVCDTVPYTWLCSSSDAGSEADAHPKDKTAIGHRLALLARHHVYGEDILSDAPRALRAEAESLPGGEKDPACRVIVTFANAGDGLYIEGECLNAMQISCGDTCCDFDAATDGDRLILTLRGPAGGACECPAGGTITLAFAETGWYCVNLYNSAGIPAVPFELTI